MSNIVEYTVLRRGRSVPTSLYNSVRKQVEKRTPELYQDIKYTLRRYVVKNTGPACTTKRLLPDWLWLTSWMGNAYLSSSPAREMRIRCGTG